MTNERTEELLKIDTEHIIHPYAIVGKNPGIIFESTRNINYIVDTNKKEYFDLNAGLMCVNLGHGQPELQNAIIEAIKHTDYTTSFYGFSNPYVIECAKLLKEITPGDLNYFFFVSGGSEAIDSIIKTARLYWHFKGYDRKQKIICLYNSYHGETGISTYLTRMGQGMPQRGFGAEPGGYVRIPNYYCYRCPFDRSYPDCNVLCARFLQKVIEGEGEDSIAAVIIEPIQGSGGVIDPPPEYLKIVREICTSNNILMIADEVMSGFARTGKMFAVEHYDIVPDMMAMAKGITSAYIPFGAIAFNKEIYNALEGNLYLHGLTYSAHPVASAASVAALKLYKKLNVVENAANVGRHIRNRLDTEFLPLPCVGNIGGKGMFQGIELVSDKHSKTIVDAEIKQNLWLKMLDKGLYGRITGAFGNRLFVTPPCTTTIDEIDKALDILLELVSSLGKK